MTDEIPQDPKTLADSLNRQAIAIYQNLYIEKRQGTYLAAAHQADFEKIIDLHEKALQLDPGSQSNHHNLGWTLNENFGRYDESIAHLEKAVELAGSDVDAYDFAILAHVLSKADRPAEALAVLERALQVEENGTSLGGYGYVLIHCGANARAIPYIEKAIAYDPDNIIHLHNLRCAQEKLSARESSSKEIDPYTDVYLDSQKLSMQRDHYETALLCLQKVVAAEPNYPEFQVNLGHVLNILHRHEEALPLLKKLEQQLGQEKSASLSKELAYALNGQGLFEEALVHITEVMDSGHAWNAELQNSRGYALNGLYRYKEALVYLESALEVNPCYSPAFLNMGRSYESLGNIEEAKKCYRKALETAKEPDTAFVLSRANEALKRMGKDIPPPHLSTSF
ncbi:MAG: tetratricopeptide repeat protein [Proteobacteria bacterium]|nr:tetratricopeptide repeat protein [Pseudomonadota bacterium]